MPCIDTVQGFSFCLAACEPLTSIYSSLSVIHANYTPKTPKPFAELYSGVSVDLPYSSTHNIAATQTAYAPPAPRWRAYRQALHLRRYQTPPPLRTLYRSTQPPYYNKVYKDAVTRPFYETHIRQCSIAQTMPARRLAIWHRSAVMAHRVSPAPSTRRGSPAASARRAGGTTGGYRRTSFRAFAR